MKRFLISLALLCCALWASPKYIGDVNGDGVIDIADVTAMVSLLLSPDNSAAVDTRLTDVDGNGALGPGDLSALVDIILGRATAQQLEGAAADTLFIRFTDQAVTYDLPTAWQDDVSVRVSGTDVVVDNSNVTDEYVTLLSGSCQSGSFIYNGSFKTTIVLAGLTLTNPSGAAIDIEDGKRVSLELADGTANTLADGAGSQKAALYCKGHLEISRGGSLTVAGSVKHAISAKEYIELKKTTGLITLTAAPGDAIHAGQYYMQKGGQVVVRSGVMGDGIQAEARLAGDEYDGQMMISGGTVDITLAGSDVAGLKADSLLSVTGGQVTIVTTGDDAKGLKSKANISVADGTIDVTQSGGYIISEVATTDGTVQEDPSFSAALKADSMIIVSGGTIHVNSTAEGGRGLNADKGISVTGGQLQIDANGPGGTLDLSSTATMAAKSFRLYVALPASYGYQPSAWTNVYLYDASTDSQVAALADQKSFTIGGTTTTFYYYDFKSATSGTYYLKSDDYTSGGGGWGGSTSYTIRSADITLNMTGSDAFYSIASTYQTSNRTTRTYAVSNVTSTWANAVSASEEGETYKACCLKSDALVSIAAATLTLTHSGTMSKGIKAPTVNIAADADITDTAAGSYMIVGTDPAYSTAVKCDHYVGSDGRLTIKATGSASRGISADSTLTITGGTYDITLTGDGATYTGDGSTEGVGSRGLKSDGDMTLKGGDITINSSARGGKGIKVGTSSRSGAQGARLVVGDAASIGQGPVLSVTTTGAYLASESSGGQGGWGGPGGGMMDSGFIGSTKAVKVMGPVEVYGGTVSLATSTQGAEGLESKHTITIYGGSLQSSAYDDAINAASTITFNGGYVWAHASNNDAIDSNDASTGIVINDGVVIASGSSSPEEGFDCDNAAFQLNGGVVIGTGGSQGGGGGGGGKPTSARQPYVTLSSVSLSASTYVSLKDASGSVVCSYRIPQTTSQAMLLMSAPQLSSASRATVVYGSTAVSNPATSHWDGVYTTGATLTGGSSISVTPTGG